MRRLLQDVEVADQKTSGHRWQPGKSDNSSFIEVGCLVASI